MVMQFIRTNWKFLSKAMVLLLVVGIVYMEWRQYRAEHKKPPIVETKSLTHADVEMAVAAAMSKAKFPSGENTKEIREYYTKEIIKAAEEGKPDAKFTGTTDKELDQKAKEQGAKDKADAIVKQPIDDKHANYFGIHKEKYNEIKYGGTKMRGDPWRYNIGYENDKRNFEIIVHSRSMLPTKGEDIEGVTAMGTIIKF